MQHGAFSPGALIAGRYQLTSLLGQGGMGSVFLAHDLHQQQKKRALKALRLTRDTAMRTDLALMFKAEFAILATLAHPHIARVYDFGSNPGLFFISELVEGRPLTVAAAGATLEEIFDLTVQICRALEYLASKKIIHGDLKPSNILVEQSNGVRNVKIVDFGLATDFFRTLSSMRYGTPPYTAPEILLGLTADHRADLYSLGVILYTLVTGETPDDPAAVRPPHTIRTDLPEAASRMILRMMDPHPQQRYFRANQVIEEISRFSRKNHTFETPMTRDGYLASAQLVGRDQELRRLHTLHQQDKPAVAFIVGDAGMGKSRLLQAFKHTLQLHECPVIEGNDNLAAVLETYAHHPARPTLFFDDLDRQTTETIDRLAQAQSGLFIVAAMRPAGLTEHMQQRFPTATTLVPAPLTTADIALLLESILGSDIPGELAKKIEQISNGNPLLIVETVKTLQERGDYDAERVNIQSLHLPTSLQEAYFARYAAFSDVEQKVLQTLALEESPLPSKVICAVLSTLGGAPFHPEDLLKALAGFLHDSTVHLDLVEGGAVYQIRPEALRTWISTQTPAGGRTLRHRALAQALQIHVPARPDKIARHYFQAGDFPQALAVSRQAAAAAKTRAAWPLALEMHAQIVHITEQKPDGHLEILLDSHEQIAQICQCTGDFERALEHLQRAVTLADAAGAPHLNRRAALRRQIGEIYQLKVNPDKAMQALDEAAALLTANPDPRERLHILWVRGRILHRLGRFQEMASEAEQGIHECRSAHMQAQEAELLYNRGLARCSLGDLEGAHTDLQKSVMLFEAEKLPARTALPLNALGITRYRQGIIDDAIQYYTRAYEVAHQVGDHRLLINFAMNIGTIFHQRNQFAQAKDFYERALTVARRIRQTGEEAKILSNLGYLFFQFSHFEKAIELLSAALAIAANNNFQDESLWIQLVLGEIALARHELPASQTFFENSLKIARSLGYPQKTADALHGLAAVFTSRKKFTEAKTFLDEAAALCQSIDAQETLLENSWRWAEWLIAQTRETPGNLDAARPVLERSFQWAEELKDRRRLWRLAFLRADFEANQGRVEESRKLYERALALAMDYAQLIPSEFRHYFINSAPIVEIREKTQQPGLQPADATRPLRTSTAPTGVGPQHPLLQKLLTLDGSKFFGWFMDVLEALHHRHGIARTALFDVEGGLDEALAFWNPADEHRPFDVTNAVRFPLLFRGHELGALYVDGWQGSSSDLEPWVSLLAMGMVTKKFAI